MYRRSWVQSETKGKVYAGENLVALLKVDCLDFANIIIIIII